MSAKNQVKKVEGNILALGEFTGHHHRATGADVAVYETENGQRYLEAPQGAVIVHEEHKPLEVAPGSYDMKITRETDPYSEEIRSVRD